MTRTSTETSFAYFEREYAVYFLQRFPVVATYLGGACFDARLAGVDGQLRDYSSEALHAEDSRLAQFRQQLEAFPESDLSAVRRADRSIALAQIEFLLHLHRVRRHQERALDTFVEEPFYGVDWQIQGMSATGPNTVGTFEEWRRVIERTCAIPRYLAVATEQLRAGIAAQNTPDWRVLVHSGIEAPVATAEYFARTLPETAVANVPPDAASLSKEIEAAGRAAARSYLEFRAFIAQSFFEDAQAPHPSVLKAPFQADRYALGSEEYDWALRNNFQLNVTAAQLYEASWPVVERTRADMAILARDIARDRGWQVSAEDHQAVAAVFKRLSGEAPRTDAEMLQEYRRVERRIVEYVKHTDLFAVPDDFALNVEMTPGPLRSTFEAAYFPPPPFKGTGKGRFYVTPTGDDAEQLKQQHNRHVMADLAAHEGCPGHAWFYDVTARNLRQISPIRWLKPGGVNDSSSMWADALADEGWALYAEGLLAEPRSGARQGFYSPEERLYQLRFRLYREVRVTLDIGLHTGRLGFEEAVSLFSQTLDFLPGSCADADALRDPAKCASCKAARFAITRYARQPTQAITYRLGKDQIVALKTQARDALGEHFSEQRFHLQFMKQGMVPPAYFADELIETLKTSI